MQSPLLCSGSRNHALSPKNSETFPRTKETRETSLFLTEAETNSITSLTPQQIELIKEWNLDNLVKQKTRIVGVRSEDLFFLFDCIHKGSIPVETETLLNRYYVAANPESGLLTQYRPEALETITSTTFSESAERNIEDKSFYTVVKRTLERNLLSRREIREKLVEELRHFYKDLRYTEEDLYFREFYSDLAHEITKNANVLRFNSRTRPALSLLSRHVEAAFPLEVSEQFMVSLAARRGVLMAFNEKIFQKYRFIEGDHEDMVFDVPLALDLETIIGFESLGEFEDSVLAELRPADSLTAAYGKK